MFRFKDRLRGLFIQILHNRTISVKHTGEKFTREKINIKKLNKLCKKIIGKRSRIPYHIIAKTNCPDPVLTYNAINFYNYSFINNNDPVIQHIVTTSPLLCDIVFKYYNKPKFGLRNNAEIQNKYNLNIGLTVADNLYVSNPSTLTMTEQGNNKQAFNTFKLKTNKHYLSMF